MRITALTLLVTVFSCGANAKDLSVEALRKADGFTWVQRKSANFDFFVESGTAAARDLDFVVERMETGRTAVERLLGSRIQKRMSVFVVPSRARVKELTGNGMNAFANGTSVFAFYESSTSYALGSHETCHNLALARWKLAKSVGIDEGVAVYSDDRWQGRPLHLVAKWLLDRDKLFPLADLLKDGSRLPDADMITYPELGSFVKFIYETYGLKSVQVLWQRGIDDIGRAFSGKTLLQVETEWRSMLRRLDASSLDYKL